MIVALLLLAVGLGDLVRHRVRGTLAPLLGVAVGLAVLTGGALVTGAPLLECLLVAPIVVIWMLAMRSDGDGRLPLWPLPVVGLAVLAGAVAGTPASEATGPAVAWLEALSERGVPDIALGASLTVVAVSTALVTTANLIVRSVLDFARGTVSADAERDDSRWAVRVGRRQIATLERDAGAPHSARSGGALLGGRLIGPLERLLIVLLAAFGAQALIAALLAAKGIVRFPEISADRRFGSKAEEFLIGSLTSWALAALAWGLVAGA
jgi:hypothetical protein